jgi:hypothetical protein
MSNLAASQTNDVNSDYGQNNSIDIPPPSIQFSTGLMMTSRGKPILFFENHLYIMDSNQSFKRKWRYVFAYDDGSEEEEVETDDYYFNPENEIIATFDEDGEMYINNRRVLAQEDMVMVNWKCRYSHHQSKKNSGCSRRVVPSIYGGPRLNSEMVEWWGAPKDSTLLDRF